MKEREKKKKEQTFWNNEVLTFWAPHFTFLQQCYAAFFTLLLFIIFTFMHFSRLVTAEELKIILIVLRLNNLTKVKAKVKARVLFFILLLYF